MSRAVKGLTTAEVAAMAGVKTDSVKMHCYRGTLQAWKDDKGCWRIHHQTAKSFVRNRRSPGRPKKS